MCPARSEGDRRCYCVGVTARGGAGGARHPAVNRVGLIRAGAGAINGIDADGVTPHGGVGGVAVELVDNIAATTVGHAPVATVFVKSIIKPNLVRGIRGAIDCDGAVRVDIGAAFCSIAEGDVGGGDGAGAINGDGDSEGIGVSGGLRCGRESDERQDGERIYQGGFDVSQNFNAEHGCVPLFFMARMQLQIFE